jgi:hypothetical protein
MSHIKISVYYDATECPTSRYPYITMQQNVPHHDDYFPFLLNGLTPNCRRCKPLTPPTLSFASPSLPTVRSVLLLLLCRPDQYCLHHDTFGCSVCRTAGCWYLPAVHAVSSFAWLQPLQVNALCTAQLVAAVGWWLVLRPLGTFLVQATAPTPQRRGGCLQLAQTRQLQYCDRPVWAFSVPALMMVR